jgi:FAD/FMN-containing dehydrogenase
VLVPELDKVPNKSPPAAYMNEADTFEPNWQSVFYGKNYRALLRVKRQYDPNGVFWARTAVGSELWTEGAGGRLCRT